MSFQALYEIAERNFTVVEEAKSLGVTYVEAEAGTGSRYAVMLARYPGGTGVRNGGEWLLTVIQPWQTCYTLNPHGELHENYIAEKFLRPGRTLLETHGGDFKALSMTINRAIEVATSRK